MGIFDSIGNSFRDLGHTIDKGVVDTANQVGNGVVDTANQIIGSSTLDFGYMSSTVSQWPKPLDNFGNEVVGGINGMGNEIAQPFSQSNLDAFGQQILGGLNDVGKGLKYISPFLPGGGGIFNLNKKKTTSQTTADDSSLYLYGFIGVVGVILLMKMKK